MLIYERIKHLRKNQLKITQDAFAEKINISRSNLGNIETGKVGVTERVIADICKEFAVNREWLEHGTGEMFDESSPSIVDMLVEKYNLSDTARKILDVYITLDTDDKDAIDRFVQKVAETMEAKPDSPAVSAVMQQYSNEAMVARGASEPLKPFTPEQDAQMLSETDPDDL